ncbi:integral membrane protein sed5 [Artemisia annua]|uniref:Integral membrane protein sed5 n=1 Tax=Artemisia annua TaxID=35608 RepID=A0A2U1PXA5_ARTAN|nr:integral membrane protein sed5 [Artemisia annua]
MRSSTHSSFRDRTHEFNSIVQELRQLRPSTANHGSEIRSKTASKTEFNKRASKIGSGIHQTSLKLAKLAQLAKQTNKFNDPTKEIQELTAVIKQDITALNGAVVDLQLICNSQQESDSSSSDTSTHSTTVVVNLKNRLIGATQEFKEVLTMRKKKLKDRENRRLEFSKSTSKEPANPFARQQPLAHKSSANASNAPPAWVKNSSSSPLFPRKLADGESQPLIQQQQSQQQQQMVPEQDNYMQSRAEALQSVESTVHELGGIFTQLATMVSQQGEIAIRIDENMEDTLANVEGAQEQLMRYLNGISSNRWLMIKIFFILIVFLMIFLFFVA